MCYFIIKCFEDSSSKHLKGFDKLAAAKPLVSRHFWDYRSYIVLVKTPRENIVLTRTPRGNIVLTNIPRDNIVLARTLRDKIVLTRTLRDNIVLARTQLDCCYYLSMMTRSAFVCIDRNFHVTRSVVIIKERHEKCRRPVAHRITCSIHGHA